MGFVSQFTQLETIAQAWPAYDPFFGVGEGEHLPKETLEIVLLFSLEETKCPDPRKLALWFLDCFSLIAYLEDCFRQWRWLVQCPLWSLSCLHIPGSEEQVSKSWSWQLPMDSQGCPVWCPRILWQASTEGLALHQRNTARKSLSFRADLKYVEILDCSSLSCHTPPPAEAVMWIITEHMPVLACIKFPPYKRLLDDVHPQ